MKKTIFILITILAATASFAQDASNDSIRKRIREMKLSEEYVYAESGSITDFAEAKPAASEKLHAAAITLMTEHQKGKEELKSIWAKAEKQMLFMEYNNGALFKVFAYLPKSSLIEMQPKAETATSVETTSQPTIVHNAPMPKTPWRTRRRLQKETALFTLWHSRQDRPLRLLRKTQMCRKKKPTA